MKTWKPIVQLVFLLAIAVNGLTYAAYTFSFGAAWRPADLSRGDAAILTAIYFVGMALLIGQMKE